MPVKLGEQLQHLAFVGDIGLHGDGLAAGLGDLVHQRLGCCLLPVIVQAQCIALSRRQPGSGSANAAAGSGDQHDLAHRIAPCKKILQRLEIYLSSHIFSYAGCRSRVPYHSLNFRRFKL